MTQRRSQKASRCLKHRLWVAYQPMRSHDLVALEGRELEDGSTQITHTLDLDSARPIEVPGGDVVFVDVLARTEDGAALKRVGDRPVASTSVYNREQLVDALSEHYDREHAEFALSNTISGESGTQAARIAESRTHDHPAQIESAVAGRRVATDGGEPSGARRASSELVSDGGTAGAGGMKAHDQPRVDTSIEVLGHPDDDDRPVEEGEHYSVSELVEYEGTAIPVMITWVSGPVDTFTDAERSRANRETVLEGGE